MLTRYDAARHYPEVVHDVQRIFIDSLYYGFPVSLLSTWNDERQQTNLTPISSAWSLGDQMIIGLGKSGQTVANLKREPKLIVSLPTPALWESIEKIADTTGAMPVTGWMKDAGYRSVADKFAEAGLSRSAMRGGKLVRLLSARYTSCWRRITWVSVRVFT